MPKKIKSSTESTVNNPVATQLSMYDAGRPTTMADANRWPSITAKRDTPAPSPTPRALTVSPTSGRAQTQVQFKTPTLNTAHPMTERFSHHQTDEQTSIMESLKNAASQRQVQVTKYAPYNKQALEDIPGETIPPKPPHHTGISTAMTGLNCSHQLHRLGHKSQAKSSLHSTTTALPPLPKMQMRKLAIQTPSFQKEKRTSDLQQGAATKLDAKATINQWMQQWENMQTFYSSTKHWPMHNQFSTQIEGESPLVWMMVHSSSAATQLQTYAWIENLDHPLPGKDPALPKERPPEDTQDELIPPKPNYYKGSSKGIKELHKSYQLQGHGHKSLAWTLLCSTTNAPPPHTCQTCSQERSPSKQPYSRKR